MKAELRALTSVRGIAAWLVVLFHLRQSLGGLPAGVQAVLARGYLAVDFFFLLSGFVIWLSWSERLRAGGWRAVPAFLQRRVARIWPLHLFVLAGGVALALLLAATGRHDAAMFPWGELPMHLLLVQNWGFTDALSWNVPAWSISCEMAAYLLFPALAMGIDWRRMPSWAVIAAIAALLVLLSRCYAASGAAGLDDGIPHLGLVRALLEFASGSAVCALWLRWRAAWRVAAPASGALALGLLAGWGAGAVPETLAAPMAFAAALLALALSAGKRGNPLEGRALHWLGEISYATYLSHYLLWFAIKLVLVRDLGAVPWWVIGVYLLAVLAASAGLYRWVEMPAQHWVNGARPWRSRRAGPRVAQG